MSTSTKEEYSSRLKKEIDSGWEVASEGPSGAQLKKGKSIRSLTVIFAIIGVLGLFANILVGIVFLILAGLNHTMTKEKKKFLQR